MLVNSYDENAPRPKVGSRWVWEIDKPSVRSLIEVTEVKWNGEEWWVATQALIPDNPRELFWNDLSRFWEACVPVLPKITGRLDQFTENGPVRAKV